MPHPNEEQLVASLPPAAAEPLRLALANPEPKSKEAAEALKSALKAVAFPEGRQYPLPASLTPAQRALAEVLAYRESFSVYPAAMPSSSLRKKWLGLEPGGVLESEEVDVDGRKEPLWRALQLAGFDYGRMGSILNAMPAERALRAFGEIFPFGYNLDANSLFAHGKLRLPAELRGEGRDWAVEQAERLSKEPALNRNLPLRWLAFTALVRAQVPIQPQWDVLLPLGPGPLTSELVRAIPAERRAAAIVGALKTGERPHSGIMAAVELLEEFPLVDVAKAVLAQAETAGEFPGKADVRPRIQELASRHPELWEAIGGRPPEPKPAPPPAPAPEPVAAAEPEPAPEPQAAPEPAKPSKKPAAKKEPAKKEPAPKKEPAAKEAPPKKEAPAKKEPAAKKAPAAKKEPAKKEPAPKKDAKPKKEPAKKKK